MAQGKFDDAEGCLQEALDKVCCACVYLNAMVDRLFTETMIIFGICQYVIFGLMKDFLFFLNKLVLFNSWTCRTHQHNTDT